MLWKPSNYTVPGDAAATFLRTAWLDECKGSPAPDEMWETSVFTPEAQGSEPEGPSPDCVSSRTESTASIGRQKVCPTWRKTQDRHQLSVPDPPTPLAWVALGYLDLRLGEKYLLAVGNLRPVTALGVHRLFILGLHRRN